MTVETYFYDAAGNEVEPESAVRAERVTRSESGSVLSVDYFTVQEDDEEQETRWSQ